MSGKNLEKILCEQEEKLRLEKVLSILLEADLVSMNKLLEMEKQIERNKKYLEKNV